MWPLIITSSHCPPGFRNRIASSRYVQKYLYDWPVCKFSLLQNTSRLDKEKNELTLRQYRQLVAPNFTKRLQEMNKRISAELDGKVPSPVQGVYDTCTEAWAFRPHIQIEHHRTSFHLL